MDRLRTPDDAVADLPDFPFAAHHVEVPDPDGDPPLRLHHLDEGPPDGRTIVLLHGEPTWSYLYRHVVPPLVADGHRVVAPDLIGFGRSDKPVEVADHSYARHVAWLAAALFDALDLRDVVLFCQDWGGLLGLRLVAEHPERFAAVVAANTGLPTGDERVPDAFREWQRLAHTLDPFPTGHVVAGGCVRPMPDAVRAAYDAPFPDATFQAGPKALPALVPTQPDDPASADNRRAWDALARFERPFVTAYSDQDPITRGADRRFRDRVPGAVDDLHRTVTGAGHFLQEDAPEAVVEVVRDVLERV